MEEMSLYQENSTSPERNKSFESKIIPEAFFTVNEYGEKQYLATKGYETTAQGAKLDLKDITPSNDNGKFDKEVYVQEQSFDEEPGRILYFKYSHTQNTWIVDDGSYTFRKIDIGKN